MTKRAARIDFREMSPKEAEAFELTFLAGQCVKKGIRLTDLGRVKVVDGKFIVKEVKQRGQG